MSRDVIMVGSTMRIPLLYWGKYLQWRERFMNSLEEQTDGEAMINSIQNGDQPLPVIAHVSLAGNAQNAPHTLKDPKFWTAEEKKTRKIDRLARSLLIQELPNDIYSLIDSNKTATDLWDALERQMRGSEYGEQDRKATILQTKNLMDINIDALYNILKQNQGDVNDALGYKKKTVVVTSDSLALVAEKTNQSSITEFVYLVEAHHHLNPIFISKDNNPKRLDNGVVMLVLEARGRPLRFGEVHLSLVALNPKLEVFYVLSYNQLSGPLVDGHSENLLVFRWEVVQVTLKV
uniref:Integrase, catalytic region, zinc finger, CCHC-type, peptidase aspartic, catalytic n=1 Tax=Tanacetum cinerariifolium TaxID=118510 RepID=A0A6L2JDD3_TANCI|nr:hypothetical protein [Tanacetum cinerariifolium]